MSTRELDAKDPYILSRRVLEDGRVVRLHKMFGVNTRLSLASDEEDICYSQLYCYHDTAKAMEQALVWNGEGDPEGWYRHINTGRRRPDGDLSKEYIAR